MKKPSGFHPALPSSKSISRKSLPVALSTRVATNGTPVSTRPIPARRKLRNLLGADRQQQFEAYKNTLMERESVVQLRTRLPDASRLPDERAEALIAALADERQKIHMEAAQRGAGMNGLRHRRSA